MKPKIKTKFTVDYKYNSKIINKDNYISNIDWWYLLQMRSRIIFNQYFGFKLRKYKKTINEACKENID